MVPEDGCEIDSPIWRTTNWSNLNPEFLAQISGGDLSGHPARRCRAQRRRFPEIHGTRRSLDGISFCWLCAHTFGVSAELGLVSQRNFLVQANTSATRGDLRRRFYGSKTATSGNSPSARDFQVLTKRMVPVGKDLRTESRHKILLSIDPTSFPLGTGPKQHEIWHSGYYPVVWTNKKYRMIYFNMGHNDIDYEHRYDTTNKTLSYTFNNTIQDRLIIDGLLWLGDRDKKCTFKATPPWD